tara:strand:- start:905 stop:1540 length:636 start_codon:yes stop_codon:yes gene_type:complete
MNGKKALAAEKYARKNNLNFIRFDCRGHGKSDGKFEDYTIADWKNDLIEIIDNLTRGPQILVGSSMGGWLMLLAAKARPSRIKGMIGLAAAADFGNDLYKNLSKAKRKELQTKGITKYSSYGFSYYIRKNFFKDAKTNKILNKIIRYKKPLILIHGLKDNVVSKKVPEIIAKKITGKNVQIIYLKNSDHRLSTDFDLKIINHSLELIIKNN